MQLGKSLSIVFLLFGAYLIYHLLFSSSSPLPGPRPSSHQVYHIGCYDLDRPINHSIKLQQSIAQFQNKYRSHSPQALEKLRAKLDQGKVKVGGANAMARQFEKYITTYESVRSHNQYEQTFFNTLRKTRQDYLDCRSAFNSKPWDCRNLSLQYNATTDHFNELRDKLRGLVDKKNKHTADSVQMLRDDQIKIDESYNEQYNQQLQKLNGKIIRKERELGDVVTTLDALKNTILKKEQKLNQTITLLYKCQTNKKEIQFCKNISEYVTQIYHGEELEKLQKERINKKRIIDLQRTIMIQSKKLGENIEDLQRILDKLNAEYKELERLYHDALNASKCAQDWQTQCQPDTIKTYQKNITTLREELANLRSNQKAIRSQIDALQKQLQQLQKQNQQLQEQMKNQVIDIDYLKVAEEKKKKEVEKYREILNNIRVQIAHVKAQLADTSSIRTQQNQDIDQLMARGEELIDCLGKKSLYDELAKRKPRQRPEDGEMKRRVAVELGQRIRQTLQA